MSKFGLAFELSPNTILAPLRIKALAVEGKVKEGIMTSSPGEIPAKIAHISKASVHEVVSRTFLHPNCSWRS